VGFRAECEQCTAFLHCCKNCQFYKPGLSNDCQIPDTARVVDREGCNFCEEFSVRGKQQSSGDVKSASRALFGDDEESGPSTSSVDSLFKE
jgi:hypothetical protein